LQNEEYDSKTESYQSNDVDHQLTKHEKKLQVIWVQYRTGITVKPEDTQLMMKAGKLFH
jgi:hypothetical protein